MKNLTVMLFLLIAEASFGLTAKEVVSSSLKHYPEVKDALLNLEVSSAEKSGTEGAFDAKIIGKGDSRTSGFYNGEYVEAKIVKPFKFLNSRVYGGVRQSDDLFPSYEGKLDTLSQGEMMFGFSVSLLRDSMIDQNRFELFDAKEAETQAKIQVLKRKVIVQTLALQTYWEWFALGHQVKVSEEVLNLAKSRDSNLRKRIRAGDLARIYQTENEQYILTREAKYLNSLNKFQKSSLMLSLFYRDDEGKPLKVSIKDLPSTESVSILKKNISRANYETVESRNLKIRVLESKVKQAKNMVRLGKNLYLPKLDFTYEYSKDSGEGEASLVGGENRLMLNFEIPLEFNKAQGKKRAGSAKLSQAQTELKFIKEKLRAELNKVKFDLENTFKVYMLTKRKIGLAQKLVKAEERKFRSGASDLILVNLREQSYAQAQIENLEAILDYQLVLAELKKLLVEFV